MRVGRLATGARQVQKSNTDAQQENLMGAPGRCMSGGAARRSGGTAQRRVRALCTVLAWGITSGRRPTSQGYNHSDSWCVLRGARSGTAANRRHAFHRFTCTDIAAFARSTYFRFNAR